MTNTVQMTAVWTDTLWSTVAQTNKAQLQNALHSASGRGMHK